MRTKRTQVSPRPTPRNEAPAGERRGEICFPHRGTKPKSGGKENAAAAGCRVDCVETATRRTRPGDPSNRDGVPQQGTAILPHRELHPTMDCSERSTNHRSQSKARRVSRDLGKAHSDACGARSRDRVAALDWLVRVHSARCGPYRTRSNVVHSSTELSAETCAPLFPGVKPPGSVAPANFGVVG